MACACMRNKIKANKEVVKRTPTQRHIPTHFNNNGSQRIIRRELN